MDPAPANQAAVPEVVIVGVSQGWPAEQTRGEVVESAISKREKRELLGKGHAFDSRVPPKLAQHAMEGPPPPANSRLGLWLVEIAGRRFQYLSLAPSGRRAGQPT